MADEIRAGREDTYHVFKSLQYSLYLTLFISVIGGGCFLMSSLFLVKDKKAAYAANRGGFHDLLLCFSPLASHFMLRRLINHFMANTKDTLLNAHVSQFMFH